jgi:hypothetical protein
MPVRESRVDAGPALLPWQTGSQGDVTSFAGGIGE